MENSQQQFSNDSFSHGWLISIKPSFDFLSDSHRSDVGSFIEMDPHFLSMRWSTSDHAADGAEFDLGLPWTSSLSSPRANADRIFDDAHHLSFSAVSSPPRLDAAAAAPAGKSAQRNSSKSSSCFDSVPSRTASSASSPAFHSPHSTPSSMSSSASSHKSHASSGSAKIKSPLVRNLSAKPPRKLLLKYLRFFITLYKKIKSLRMESPKPERSSKVSARSSPRSSSAFSSMEWCRSNADISISDAILYCKRSNDQDSK